MGTNLQSGQNVLISECLLFWDTTIIEIPFFCITGILLASVLALQVSQKWNMGVQIWGLNNICCCVNFSPVSIFVWLSSVGFTFIRKTFASFLKQYEGGGEMCSSYLPYNNDLCLIQGIVGLVNNRPTYIFNICKRLSTLFGSGKHSAACLLMDTSLRGAEWRRVGCLQHCSMLICCFTNNYVTSGQ